MTEADTQALETPDQRDADFLHGLSLALTEIGKAFAAERVMEISKRLDARHLTPPVGETSALAEELDAAAEEYAYNPDSLMTKPGIGGYTAVCPEGAFKAGARWQALRKPAEPVGDEVERVARAIAAASYIDLSVAIGEAGGITNAVAEFGMDAISDDPRYRKWRLPSCRGVILAARAAITALSSTPERGWQPIETAPRDGTWFLACATEPGWGATRIVRFAHPDDCLPFHGEGIMWPSAPTHWQALPEPPALTKGSTDE